MILLAIAKGICYCCLGFAQSTKTGQRLDWYNGIEFGWGEFFDYYSVAPQYLTQISYWLDEEAKNTKVWTTVLTGPTGMNGNTGNTTVLELGIQHNWNKCWYQIIDSQMCWSECPIFGPKPPGYHENAYDVYTYIGRHLDAQWDVNARLEWYYDQNGGGSSTTVRFWAMGREGEVVARLPVE